MRFWFGVRPTDAIWYSLPKYTEFLAMEQPPMIKMIVSTSKEKRRVFEDRSVRERERDYLVFLLESR
jgi:hypothetical protein